MIRRALFAGALALGLFAGAVSAQAPDQALEGDRTTGRADAPVTVTAYLSPTCPHCADWFTSDWPAFKAAYVTPGRVRMVWRELPTSPQQLASAGIIIARCAPADRYEDVLQALMSGQEAMYATRQPGPWLQAAGQAAGLDQAGIDACLADEDNLADLNARLALAQADQVRGTPSMLVNGEKLADPHLASLRAAVDARLGASRAP